MRTNLSNVTRREFARRVAELRQQHRENRLSGKRQPANGHLIVPKRPVNEDLAAWRTAGRPRREKAEAQRLYAEHCKDCDQNLKGCGTKRTCMDDHLPLPKKCYMATATCELWESIG